MTKACQLWQSSSLSPWPLIELKRVTIPEAQQLYILCFPKYKLTQVSMSLYRQQESGQPFCEIVGSLIGSLDREDEISSHDR